MRRVLVALGLGFFSVLFFPFMSSAQGKDDIFMLSYGTDLLDDCNYLMSFLDRKSGLIAKELQDEAIEKHKLSYCSGLIKGVLLQGLQQEKENKSFCPPDNVSIEQVIRVVTKDLNNNPERLHESDIVLVWLSLKKGFPCEKQQP